MVPPAAVERLEQELTAAGADWQVHIHGNAMLAFTNPKASDPEFGTVYDAAADRRAWAATTNFLAEVLT
jgi:dienelactone hydrolase